jgi:hypothetical protein
VLKAHSTCRYCKTKCLVGFVSAVGECPYLSVRLESPSLLTPVTQKTFYSIQTVLSSVTFCSIVVSQFDAKQTFLTTTAQHLSQYNLLVSTGDMSFIYVTS